LDEANRLILEAHLESLDDLPDPGWERRTPHPDCLYQNTAGTSSENLSMAEQTEARRVCQLCITHGQVQDCGACRLVQAEVDRRQHHPESETAFAHLPSSRDMVSNALDPPPGEEGEEEEEEDETGPRFGISFEDGAFEDEAGHWVHNAPFRLNPEAEQPQFQDLLKLVQRDSYGKTVGVDFGYRCDRKTLWDSITQTLKKCPSMFPFPDFSDGRRYCNRCQGRWGGKGSSRRNLMTMVVTHAIPGASIYRLQFTHRGLGAAAGDMLSQVLQHRYGPERLAELRARQTWAEDQPYKELDEDDSRGVLREVLQSIKVDNAGLYRTLGTRQQSIWDRAIADPLG
jgi:hypothetical protein